MKVLLHGHCHQKALMKMDHEVGLLRKLGAEVQSLDSGCCGTARPFRNIRSPEIALLRPTFAVALLHGPFSSALFGGSGHGARLSSSTWMEDSLGRISTKTR